jgi:alpha-1,3-rhamnosyl/mannosyltransferase
MASGTPVIVSNASTLPEVVGDAGLMVDSCDVEGLQRSILQLIEDDDTWNALRVAGIERARTFSWRRCADETVAVYRKVHAESA